MVSSLKKSARFFPVSCCLPRRSRCSSGLMQVLLSLSALSGASVPSVLPATSTRETVRHALLLFVFPEPGPDPICFVPQESDLSHRPAVLPSYFPLPPSPLLRYLTFIL